MKIIAGIVLALLVGTISQPAAEIGQPIERLKIEAHKVKGKDFAEVSARKLKEVAPVKETDIVSRLRKLGGSALVELIRRESTFNPNAVNPSSGACGLFQRLPCSVPIGNADAQIKDGMRYIKARYGTPAKALEFHDRMGWY